MRRSSLYFAGIALFALSSTAHAKTFRFDTDPFAGTNVLNTPGRQIVGGEDFINFTAGKPVTEEDVLADVGAQETWTSRDGEGAELTERTPEEDEEVALLMSECLGWTDSEDYLDPGLAT